MKNLVQTLNLLIPAIVLGAPPNHKGGNSAALIIGGHWINRTTQVAEFKASVELFGCTEESIKLTDYPYPVYVSGGTFSQHDGRVLVCGGYSCRSGNDCQAKGECFHYHPETQSWVAAPPLLRPRFNFHMGQLRLTNSTNEPMVPYVIGYTSQSEVLDRTTNQWVDHQELEQTWYSLECLAEFDDRLVRIKRTVQDLSLSAWELTEAGDVPEYLAETSGRCAPMETEHLGSGVMNRYGYFYHLEKKSWQALAPPAVAPVAEVPNAMWSFRGLPTIFGSPVCNDVGACTNSVVRQYSPSSDEWVNLGLMSEARLYHTVVEVPRQFCQDVI